MTAWQLDISHENRPFGPADVILFYDGPVLFWLPAEQRRLLALSLPDDAGHWPFLVVELTEAQAIALLANKLTLRAACLSAQGKWVMRNYDAAPLSLEPLETIPGHWLPGDVMLQPAGAQA